jgi:hypothetical protein
MVGEPACTEVGERVEIQAAAERDADIRTFGVRVKLPAGERATFSLLSGAGR